ncbi:ABC transporter ATP-binding protein [Ruegeria atlantica]|uniref:ABC transporter ATP-binding protein n=1 Tax=Ruegeria atlantica TaxID=81569 RepID=UPI002494F4DE|nr:ABC transporter ATP-binding protein [Ruegeria atlantica]
MKAKIKASLTVWPKVFRLLRYSSLKMSVIVAVLTVIEVVVGISVLYFIKLLIDVISTQFAAEGGVDTGPVFLYLVLTGVGLVGAVSIQAFANLARTAQGMLVADYVDREIHNRAISVDLGFYESPAYFDLLERARAAGSQRPAQVISTVLLLFKSALYLVAILVMLASIEWRLLPAILVAMLMVLFIRLRFTKTLFQWQKDRIQLERRASYLDWLIISHAHAKELRLGDLGAHLKELYSSLRKRIRTEHYAIEKRKAIAELVVSGLGALIFAGAVAFLVMRTLAGELSVGDLVLFVLLFRRAEGSGQEFVRHVSKLYDDQLYLGQLFGFLAVEPEITTPAEPKSLPAPITSGLRFENVTFQYPSNPAPALEGINLTVKPGQVVALVGQNGSGKTSLIKLMARLYDPNQGRITLDGQDIRAFDPVAYRRLFSVIFQDYSHYATTVAENIRFGDLRMPADSPGIIEAARSADADGFIRTLDQGYDTPLTRVFDDGRELSLGQWQRVALARAFFPASDFIIMDEPTSAMDPNAEFELFENFREKIGQRAALIISHRLSTVRMADYTYVLDNGRIIEHGTHDDLIAAQGHYADLFERQGRNYRAVV